MNARIETQGSQTAAPRFDRKFIEEHQLIERYLEGKLPPKGARDLERWCRENPAYLDELNLSVRAGASLKLLEASGRPTDLQEPATPWWQSIYLLVGLGVMTLLALIGVWFMSGKYMHLRSQLEDAQTVAHQGTLVQPATEAHFSISPDRADGIDKARLVVNSTAPQLIDLHIDMTYLKASQYRLVVDKQSQGRALILENLIKDSNGELRMTLNTTGLSIGRYRARLEILPMHGSPVPCGWLILDVR